MTKSTDRPTDCSADSSTNSPDEVPDLWMRGLMMLIFTFCLWIARFVLLAIAVFQFLSLLFTSKTNPNLRRFGLSLSVYQCQIMRFLTFNTEKQPYPIGDWPST